MEKPSEVTLDSGIWGTYAGSAKYDCRHQGDFQRLVSFPVAFKEVWKRSPKKTGGLEVVGILWLLQDPQGSLNDNQRFSAWNMETLVDHFLHTQGSTRCFVSFHQHWSQNQKQGLGAHHPTPCLSKLTDNSMWELGGGTKPTYERRCTWCVSGSESSHTQLL